ncbi:MAG: hypothetical protein ACR2QE_13125 [Acidimicrobiales bacterium]
MRRLGVLVIAGLIVAACGSGNGEFFAEPATEEGAIAAATELQQAALRGDGDGIRRALSNECLDSIDDEEFDTAMVFLRLFTADLDMDDINVVVTVEEFEDDRAELAVEYTDDDDEPIGEDGSGFSLSADTIELEHDGTRWVAADCDFSSSDSGPGQCLDTSGTLGDCPDPTVAGRDDPIELGRSAYVADGWTARVTAVDVDAAAAIEADSGFGPDLDPGVQAVLIDVQLAYGGSNEPQNSFSLTMGGVGANNVAIDSFGCGFLPNGLNGSAQVFTGGVIEGQVCLPTAEDEVDSLLLYMEIFGSEQVFFDLRGTAVDDVVPSARGPVEGSTYHDDRLAPIAVGQPAEAGDWTVQIAAVDLDGTDSVLAASEFNDEPPAGFEYVLIQYEAAFDGNEASSSNDARPDLLTEANVSIDAGCSVSLDDEFDAFTDVFPGGSLSGTVCFLVPAEEIDGLTAFVRPDFFDDDITFLALS